MTQSRAQFLQGKTVKIISTSNQFAQASVGKIGTVQGYAPLGMVAVVGVPGCVGEYWAETFNLQVVEG